MPSARRYEGESRSSGTTRYVPAPSSSNSPRYVSPESAGRTAPRTDDTVRRILSNPARETPRTYDTGGAGPSGSRSGRGSDSIIPTDGATNPSAPRDHESDRVWQPRGETIDLSGARPAQRTPVPSLTSSRASSGPGASRMRAYERAAADSSLALSHSAVTRESILQRYRGSNTIDTDGLTRSRDAGRAPDLSTSRGGSRAPSSDPVVPSRGRSAQDPAPRGSVEATRRQREGSDRLDRLRQQDPSRARQVGTIGQRTAAASDAAASVAVGVGIGVTTGCSGGWFWNPACSPCAQWGACCGNWCNSSWWWWGSCGWGWPWWGCGWGWGCYYNNWSSGWYGYPSYSNDYPYSYSSPAPAYYTTIVYEGDGAQGDNVVNQEPAPEGGRVAQGEKPPEVQSALTRGVTQYVQLGDDAFRQGRYADAVHHYASAIEYAPDDGALYLFLSDALFATGDYHYAAYALRRSIELQPKLLDIVVDKHTFYSDPSDFDQQMELAERYLNEHFLDDDARLVLAANYLFASRPAQCADLLASSFSKSVRESTAGRLLLARADTLRGK